MKKLFAALAILAALTGAARAQIVWPSGGSSGGGGGGSPGGNTSTIQYNAGSSNFGGITDWTTSGTSDLTGASGSTLAVGGCTIGANIFCITGASLLNGNVGIGSVNAAFPLDINENTAAPAYTYSGHPAVHITGPAAGQPTVWFDTFAQKAALIFNRADGTVSSPTAVGSGDGLGDLIWLGNDGATPIASMTATVQIGGSVDLASGSWSNTSHASQLKFFTTPAGSTTALLEMSIRASGCVFIGQVSTPNDCGTNNLQVHGSVLIDGSSSGTSTIAAPATGGGTATLPAGSGTLAFGGSYCALAGGLACTMVGNIVAADSSTYGSGGVSGTTINNSVIGGSTPAAGTFTAVAASSLAMSGAITFSSNGITTSGTIALNINTANQAGGNNAGTVNIKGGNNTLASGSNNGGQINLTGGNASGAGSTGNGGSIVLTMGTSVGGSPGTLQFVNLAQTSAAQSGTICFNTSGNAVTYDATLGCLTSLEELKDIHGPITGALAEVEAFKPFWFTPINRPAGSDLAEQPGFGAHQIESIDRRLVGYDAEGNLRGVRYMEMTAVLAAALAELDSKFETYRAAHP